MDFKLFYLNFDISSICISILAKYFFSFFFPFLLVWILDMLCFSLKKTMYLLFLSKYFSWFLIHDITGFVLYVELHGLTQCTFAHCLLFRGGASSYRLVKYMLYSIQSCLHLVCVSFDHSCMIIKENIIKWNTLENYL